MDPLDLYPGLPDPLQASDPELQSKLNSIAVDDHLASGSATKRKRAPGGNKTYPLDIKLKIAKDAIQLGNAPAARKWSRELGHNVPESTVRNWKKIYLNQLRDGPVEKLAEKRKGRPTKLPTDGDKIVRSNVLSQYKTGANVSAQKVLAIGREVLRKKYPNVARSLKLGRAWAQSIFRRMNFVLRKVTKASRQPPEDIEAAKSKFFRRIKRAVMRHDIPKRLIINIDQVGFQMVPRGDFTMAPRGAKQVCQIGAKDKRMITGLLGCTMTGRLLPPQLIYKGKTDRCHPDHVFPEDWHVTHNESHWSDGLTMEQYVKEVLIPFIGDVKHTFDYDEDQKALLILDTFAAHCTEEFQDLLNAANIEYVYVPPGTTDELQPLDAAGSVNFLLKQRIKSHYSDYLSELVNKAMDEDGNLPDGWIPDLRASVLKPLHAQWIQASWEDLVVERKHIRLGWENTGIRQACRENDSQ